MQCVVERSQIRVNLFKQGAGQEAQALTCFNSWPGQDDPVDLFGLQGLNSLRHCKVGLTRSGWSNSKNNRVFINVFNVAFLIERLRADGATTTAEDIHRQHISRTFALFSANHGYRSLNDIA